MAKQDGAKNFEFPKMIADWAGYVSSFDKTNVAENLMVRGSQNVYKKISGTIGVRWGQKRQGSVNTTVSPVSSEFVWNTSWGAVYTLVISNSKLYVVISGTWYTLLSSLTKTRYVFDKWWDNTLKKDVCLFVNGTADLFKWGGGYGLIASTTANTIVLDRTIVASFLPSASGTVVVNGTTYTYTGSGGSTLTGVSPNPTGEANASAVLETVTTTSNSPAASFLSDFLKVINNQVYVGSYNSRLCYISQNTSYTNYVVPTPRAPGDPELLTLDGTLKGIGVRQGKAHIGFGSESWAVITFNDITVGSTLTQQTKVDVKPVSLQQAPYAHEFIDNVGDSLIYLALDQQVRSFGDFNDLFTAGYPSLSQEIATELTEEVFTNGSLKCVGEFIYVIAPNSGKVYLKQIRTRVNETGTIVAERLWHSPFIWNLTRISVISGVTVGFSNANPQIYELWDTNQFHDDSPSGENLPYSCILALGYRTNSRRQGLQMFDKMFTEGYMSTGTPLSVTVNYDYQGSNNVITQPINSVARPATFFSSLNPSSLGDSSLGDEPLGDGIMISTSAQDSLPKFKVINSFASVNCFEYQPIFFTDSADAQWEILATATNALQEPDEQANYIINKLRRT